MCNNNNEGYDYQRHPLLGRFNSWLLDKFEEDFHQETGPMKAERMNGLQGTVIEIGPGNGINFRYYPTGVKVIAIEPNPFMHKRLKAHAQSYNIDMELRSSNAEALDLADNSVDAVICTLVLCSVAHPKQVLSEIMRVLKPGGQYIFIEHIAAPQGSLKRSIQNLLFRPWKWLFEQCETNRETAELLQDSGFSRIDMEHFNSKAMPYPASPNIVGVAIK